MIAADLFEGVFVDPLDGGCHGACLYHVLARRSTRLYPLIRPSLPLGSNSVRHNFCLEASERFQQEFPGFLRGRKEAMWPLHPGRNQKMCSWRPQKRSQDRRATSPNPLFWHAKHAQNAHAKFVPDTIASALHRGTGRRRNTQKRKFLCAQDNRVQQALFSYIACDYTYHADVVAAKNILALGHRERLNACSPR